MRAGFESRPGKVRSAAFAAGLLVLSCAPAVDSERLLADITSPDAEIRQDAADILDRVVEKGDYQVFVRGLKSPVPLRRAQSIVFLARIPTPEARAALRDLLAVERRMMLPFNPIRMKPATDPADSRVLVASLINRSGGDPEAIGVLLRGAEEGQTVDSLAGTCFAIGALQDVSGIAFLEKSVSHPDIEVVRAAVQALGQFRQPEAVAILGRVASHRSPEVRTDVLTSLAPRDDAAAEVIIKTIGREDPSAEIRTMAYQTLSRSRNPDLVPYFLDRMKDAPPESKPAVYEALGRLTGQTFGPRADAWSQWWAKNRGALKPAH